MNADLAFPRATAARTNLELRDERGHREPCVRDQVARRVPARRAHRVLRGDEDDVPVALLADEHAGVQDLADGAVEGGEAVTRDADGGGVCGAREQSGAAVVAESTANHQAALRSS